MTASTMQTGNSSIWQVRQTPNAAAEAATPLIGAATVDAVVLGAGICGLSAALTLRAAGATVLVLEAGAIGGGASANGTGLVAPALRNWRARDLSHLPPAAGKRFARRLAESAQSARTLVAAHAPGVSMTPRSLRQLATQPAPDDDFETWSRAAEAAKIPPPTSATLTSADGHTRPTIDWHGAFTVDSQALVRALAARCRELGVRICTATPALGYGRGGLRWVVTCPEGRLDARALLIATNASAGTYSPRIAPEMMASVAVTDSWHVATRPLPQDLFESVLPSGGALTGSDGDVRAIVPTPDRSLVMALATDEKRDATRARAAAITSLARLTRAETAKQVESLVDCCWSQPVAITATGTAQFHSIGPDGYAWAGGDAGDIALAVLAGTEFANAIIAGGTTDLALPLSEPDPIPYRRLRSLIGLSTVPRRRAI